MFGDGDLVVAQAQEYLRTLAADLLGGQGGDPGQVLAVEQQQGAGDPVGELEGVVVQESGDLGPACVVGRWPGRWLRPGAATSDRGSGGAAAAQSRKSRTG